MTHIWQEKLADDTWLVSVQGRVDQNLTPALDAELNNLLEEGHNRLIVDLSQATYINSGGLRCLVTAWRKARNNGGDVFLSGLENRVQEVFAMVGFDKVFDVYPTSKRAHQAWQERE